MRTIYYIDGFNLYHLRLKRERRYRWLNLKILANQLSPPPNVVLRVNYYTARVSNKIDPGSPARQRQYLNALSSVPEIKPHFGRFLITDKLAKLTTPPEARPQNYTWNLPPPTLVRVVKVEEKGTDVSLGAHLVRDAFKNAFDQAVVISNDTDLVEPIRIVTQELNKRVGIVAPTRPLLHGAPIPSPSLRQVSSFVLYIDQAHLFNAQFPNTVQLGDGHTAIKPVNWA
jgi:uncharacterized LabA/DUF88 family protein